MSNFKEMEKSELQKVEGGFLFALWLAFSVGYLIGDLLSDRELLD